MPALHFHFTANSIGIQGIKQPFRPSLAIAREGSTAATSRELQGRASRSAAGWGSIHYEIRHITPLNRYVGPGTGHYDDLSADHQFSNSSKERFQQAQTDR